MTGPLVELLVSPGTGDRLGPVARHLSSWADVRAPEPALPTPRARLASSWRAPRLTEALAEGAPPLALWVASGDEADAAGESLPRCAVLLCDRDEVGEHLRARAPATPVIVLPRGGLDVDLLRPLPPFVRARWRRRLGLAADLLVDVRSPSTAISERLVPSALAVAAAVVVDHRWLAHALALGAAVVTDQDAAEREGATDGRELVVAEGDHAPAVAGEVALDLARGAALGREGRRLVERRYDLRSRTADLARRLGLLPDHPAARQLVVRRLAELRTPPGARVAARARVATALFAQASARSSMACGGGGR